MKYACVEQMIGNTPLVRLQRLAGEQNRRRRNVLLAKLEGSNPGGSAKDRAAWSMIRRAEERGEIKPGDHLIESTSGSTGIAMAMIAAMKGYRMTLVMPDDLSAERRACMTAYGADLILTPANVNCGGLEHARDIALEMQARGEGRVLDQFASADNPRVHYESTGPEVWRDTGGRVTHLVSGMGTTGTIMGISRFLKEKNRSVQCVGVLPTACSRIAGMHTWANGYMPTIFDRTRLDRVEHVTQAEAEATTRRLAREEGIFAGTSSGAAAAIALRIAAEVEDATIVFMVCDRGDRYLSTGVFGASAERAPRSVLRSVVRQPAAVATAQTM